MSAADSFPDHCPAIRWLSTPEHKYGNVCWWASSMLHQIAGLFFVVSFRTRVLMPTSPPGAGGMGLRFLHALCALAPGIIAARERGFWEDMSTA